MIEESALKVHEITGAAFNTCAIQQLQLQNGGQRSDPFS